MVENFQIRDIRGTVRDIYDHKKAKYGASM